MKALALMAVLLAGCIGTMTKDARIYDIANATIIPAQFVYSGKPQGTITAALPNGAKCAGEYSTIPQGSTSWGTVYGGGFAASSTTARSHPGSAVVLCEGGFTMECEYITSGIATGAGFCNDNKGGRYRLMY